MPDDLQNRGRARAARRANPKRGVSPAGLALGSLLCVATGCGGLRDATAAGAKAAGTGAASTGAAGGPTTAPRGAFLLIDGGAPAGQARLTGCDRAISDLHAALDQAGTPNTVLIAPTAGSMREALVGFGSNGATPHAVAFCGYAAETGGNIFALGTDTAPHDDLALAAVSIRAFSRVAGDNGGLVMLDLHPASADGALAAAAAAALEGAAGAWSSDATLGGTKLATTDRQPGDATLIDRAARSGAGTPDGIARALAQAAPARPAAPATPPVPVAPVQPLPVQPVPVPATPRQTAPDQASPPPTVATAPRKVAKPVVPSTQAAPEQHPATDGSATGEAAEPAAKPSATPAPASTDQATSGLAPAPASGSTPSAYPAPPPAEGGAIALAPPGATVARPPRPRVHVDPAVRSAQVALLARGLFNGRVNGVESVDTQHAVQHFQAMLGHPVTGKLTADEFKQLTGG